MGIITSGALASMVLADKILMWNVPQQWTLEDAATVCCVYATVSYHKLNKNSSAFCLSLGIVPVFVRCVAFMVM
jgi:D-arabinose 1-dehydrogenase-like Zn-dependent alcohol dehydrogenase